MQHITRASNPLHQIMLQFLVAQASCNPGDFAHEHCQARAAPKSRCDTHSNSPTVATRWRYKHPSVAPPVPHMCASATHVCQCNTPCCIAKRRSTPCCNCDNNECPWSVYIECAAIGLFVAIATPSPIFVAAAAAVSHTTSRKRRNARVPPAGSIPGCVVPASTSACTTVPCSSSTVCMGLCAMFCACVHV